MLHIMPATVREAKLETVVSECKKAGLNYLVHDPVGPRLNELSPRRTGDILLFGERVHD